MKKYNAEIAKRFGFALKEELHKRRIRQIDFAKEMGIDSTVICSWIKGRCLPTPERLLKVIEKLDLLPYLFESHKDLLEENAKLTQKVIDLTKELKCYEFIIEKITKK